MRLTKLYAFLILLLVAAPCFAQTPATKASRLGWTQQAESLADAQALTFTIYVDVLPGVAMVNPACSDAPAQMYQCEGALPAMTPGQHSLALTATSAGQESDKSSPLALRLVVVQTPTGLRIISAQ